MTVDEAPAPVEITVLYFAAASTVTGLSSEQVMLAAAPVPLSSLRAHLVELHPDLAKVLEASQWSINEVMVDDTDTVLEGGEEVAIIPPVSGG